MLGLMQDWPLTLDKIIDHAKANHGGREIVTRSVEGPVVRATYAEVHGRAKQVSNALLQMGIGPGDRVATLALNTARHLELWYGIMGIGAVCHTINPRLHADQLCWIIRHARDRVIFTDITFAPLLLANLPNAPDVERVVILTDEAHRPEDLPDAAPAYETLIAGQPRDCAWGGFDARTAAGSATPPARPAIPRGCSTPTAPTSCTPS